jgi:hypothetical protein
VTDSAKATTKKRHDCKNDDTGRPSKSKSKGSAKGTVDRNAGETKRPVKGKGKAKPDGDNEESEDSNPEPQRTRQIRYRSGM